MVWDFPSGSIVLDAPDRLTDVTGWHSHVPFAFWCIEALRPRVFVELGTHKGDSYCAFCQAVARLSLPTVCYAVDTWGGDHQAGLYGEDVLEDLQRHHEPRYGSFSCLVRSTFEEAASHFSDGVIDLLHIDGLHTYEAIRDDFKTWLPKLSRAAVVLFHDINVRESDFGAWRYWEELRARYPHFTFLHGHGLGVLVVGPDAPEAARRLASCDAEEATRVRSFFARLGNLVQAEAELARRHARGEAELAAKDAQVGSLTQQLGSLTQQLGALTQERDALAAALDGAKASLAECHGAWPWKVMKLFRSAKRLPGRLGHGARVALDIVYWTMTFQLRAGLRRRKYARLIRRSGLFDAGFYLSQCKGEPGSERDPIAHYLVRGAARGLDPHPLFDTSAYVEQNPAAAARGKNPLVHFIRSGKEVSALLASSTGSGPPASVSGEALLTRNPFRAAPKSGGPRRVLVVDHRVPTPDQDSGSVRMFAIVKLLREMGWAVTFVSDLEQKDERYEETLRRLEIAVHYGFSAALEHLAAEGYLYRCVLLSRPEQAFRYQPAVRAYAPEASVIYDTVDLHWVRAEREAEVTGDPEARARAERFKRLETITAACSDVVVTVTPQERDVILAEVPGARVEVVPNIHSCRTSCPPWNDRKDLMFIGGFEHSPNLDAVRWFVDQILPLVQREHPGVVLHVVGSKTPEELRSLESPSVHVAGYVPDVDPYFEGCRVFVSPLRYGAGLKGKISQSMSYGLPVVTTSIGAEGMGLVDGENALIADTPEAFARAVVRLHSDPVLWAKLSVNAMKHVQRHYSTEVVKASIEAMLSGRDAEGRPLDELGAVGPVNAA